ncbi:MAG: helix-turn-helix transcriptional regulator [Alphaproteobacteria bacterium]|nr:MAG: helix-turn-helix transcriptional regulator [Alphaproteobacteria bacterium]
MIDGRAVKRAREAAHLTQAGLAKAAGMAAQTVSAIEQGRLKWTKFLPQLARVLNLTLGELDADWAAFDAPRRAAMPASQRASASMRIIRASPARFFASAPRAARSGRSSSTARSTTSMRRSKPSANISAASAR